jgi:hypothetical protein
VSRRDEQNKHRRDRKKLHARPFHPFLGSTIAGARAIALSEKAGCHQGTTYSITRFPFD